MYLTRDDPVCEVVSFQVALPIADTTAAGVTSDELTGDRRFRVGLQGFHGSSITQPRARSDRPDPERLRARFERFRAVA